MIKNLIDEFSQFLPSDIEYIKDDSCTLILKTHNFGFSATTSWRIIKDISYKVGCEEIEEEYEFKEFNEKHILNITVQNRSFPIDPCFELSENIFIEIFSLDGLEPWAGGVIDEVNYYSDGVFNDKDKILEINSIIFDSIIDLVDIETLSSIQGVSHINHGLRLEGKNWHFATQAGWRVDGSNEILFGQGTLDFGKEFFIPKGLTYLDVMLPTLVKATIIDIRTQSTFFPYDPVFVLDDGRKIEIFSDRAENSWEFEVAGIGKWVASPKNEKVISFTPA